MMLNFHFLFRLHHRINGIIFSRTLLSSSSERITPNNTSKNETITSVTTARKPSPPILEDSYGRLHTYLRISLTERCNLRCGYCMPQNGISLTPKSHLLTTDEVLRLTALFVNEGVTKVRLTGGEPTVHKDLKSIIRNLNSLKRIDTIAITTNGLTLLKSLPELREAGLNALNVSLDTLREKKFEMITRRKGWSKVMDGIDFALQLGIHPVKVNCVVMKNVNDDEILDFVKLTMHRDIEVRFIEYMPFGGNEWHSTKMIPSSELITEIRKRYSQFHPIENDSNGTSKVYAVPNFAGRVGFISSMSDNFCGSCNRLRLLADGSLKVCLLGTAEISLRDALRNGCSDDDILALIRAAVLRKKKQHADETRSIFPRKRRSFVLFGTSQAVGSITHSVQVRFCHTFTHVGESGKATMVDVGAKRVTDRIASAGARVRVGHQIVRMIRDNELKKGDVLTVAKIAGIMATKKTPDLIPLCHNIAISFADVQLQLEDECVLISSEVRCTGRTGVEMEALTAVTVAALTVYDMCKAVSHDISIEEVRLWKKSGGKTSFCRDDP